MPVAPEQLKVELGDHVVHFYKDDADLAATVGGHLADALHEGAVVVVIATQAHIQAFKHELTTAGLDVEGALENGRLSLLDAPATLGKLTVEGRIDGEEFERHVGTLVRAVGQDGSAVRAYGEMVDLLWQAGNIGDAIELERLWNRLIDELQFSLLCAYHSASVAAPEHEHALHQVCQLHSSVSPAPGPVDETLEVSREFQPDFEAPAAARRFLTEVLRQWGHAEPLISDARLLLSELVTNAVIHACSLGSISVRSDRSKVRLSVQDMSPREPALRSETPGGLNGGRGLRIVAALSSSWGVDTTPDGKVVWAEL